MKEDLNTKPALARVLLIEDDESTRESASIKLKKEGFLVESAEDGVIGLEKLKKDNQFSAILLDIRMPKGDGFTFLEEKNKNSSLRAIPVLVFTNLGQSEYVERALALGAKGYIIKAHHSLQEIIAEMKTCIAGGVCTIDR